MPDAKQMAAYSQTVYECSPLRRGDPTGVRGTPPAPGHPIPAKVGDPSPIKYVVYIIKENRTYDQVFGDMPEGNGEPGICLFPEAVTPNHHALAREFVLLDNFYVESEVSADGHEWSMGAYASDFVERIWPVGYRGDRRVPYPSEGNVLEPARPAGGYLWDKAAEKGVSYRSYGEFVANAPTPGRARHDAGQGPGGPLRPDVPQLRHGLSRRQARRPLPRGAGRVREGRRDAATGDPQAAQRPHLGDVVRASGR